MKLKLKLDDQHTREVWQAVQRAKAEVAAWPAWKRGETNTSTTRMDSATIEASPPATKR